MSAGRELALLGWLSLGGLSLGCSPAPPDSAPEASAGEREPPKQEASVDLGALRASAVDGLEAALRDPALRHSFDLAWALESPELASAGAQLFTRAQQTPALEQAVAQLVAALQDGAIMRARLVEYAQANPELGASELSEGFAAHISERITRPEVVAQLQAALALAARELGPEVALVCIHDAGGGALLAAQGVAQLDRPALRAQLDERVGRDLGAAQARLERRLSDPRRAAGLLTAFALYLSSEAGLPRVVALLDAPHSAQSLGEGVARLLADPQVREGLERLFGRASEAEFDDLAAKRALEALLAQPLVNEQARLWLVRVARDPVTREQLAALSEEFSRTAGFEAALLEWIA